MRGQDASMASYYIDRNPTHFRRRHSQLFSHASSNPPRSVLAKAGLRLPTTFPRLPFQKQHLASAHDTAPKGLHKGSLGRNRCDVL